MDNYAAHSLELISTCGKIFCYFFLQIQLLQSADQGFILWVKKNFKATSVRKALDLADKDTLPGKIFEKFNILDVLKMLAVSWNKCPSNLLAKSWHNFRLNLQIKCDIPEMKVSDIQSNLQALELTLEEVNSRLLSNENVPASSILSD